MKTTTAKFVPIGTAAASSASAYFSNASKSDRTRPWDGPLPVGEIEAAEQTMGRKLSGDQRRMYAASFRDAWATLVRC